MCQCTHNVPCTDGRQFEVVKKKTFPWHLLADRFMTFFFFCFHILVFMSDSLWYAWWVDFCCIWTVFRDRVLLRRRHDRRGRPSWSFRSPVRWPIATALRSNTFLVPYGEIVAAKRCVLFRSWVRATDIPRDPPGSRKVFAQKSNVSKWQEPVVDFHSRKRPKCKRSSMDLDLSSPILATCGYSNVFLSFFLFIVFFDSYFRKIFFPRSCSGLSQMCVQ